MTHQYYQQNLEIARRNLPSMPDAERQALALKVDDPPPTKSYNLVGDAIRELDTGLASHGRIHRFRRASLWALLHFPLQYIPIHMFLAWESGNRILKGSLEVDKFVKTKDKQRKAIAMLKLATVGYITQRLRSDDPTTVDGFRLTTGGEDYMRHVHTPNKTKSGRILHRTHADISDECIRLEHIQNPAMRKLLKQDKEIFANLQKSGVIAHLINGQSQLLLEVEVPKK